MYNIELTLIIFAGISEIINPLICGALNVLLTWYKSFIFCSPETTWRYVIKSDYLRRFCNVDQIIEW